MFVAGLCCTAGGGSVVIVVVIFVVVVVVGRRREVFVFFKKYYYISKCVQQFDDSINIIPLRCNGVSDDTPLFRNHSDAAINQQQQ